MKTILTALILLIAVSSLSLASEPDAGDEYAIKAAMYINLLRLVDWPDGKRGDAAAPIIIGVAGSDEMARALENAIKAKNVTAQRRVVVRRISGTTGLDECHSVFLGGGDRKKIEVALQALSRRPVLTVGEDSHFVALGGMIDLILRDDRVQIEVNLEVARNSGLAIGSQLLRIAVVKKDASK